MSRRENVFINATNGEELELKFKFKFVAKLNGLGIPPFNYFLSFYPSLSLLAHCAFISLSRTQHDKMENSHINIEKFIFKNFSNSKLNLFNKIFGAAFSSIKIVSLDNLPHPCFGSKRSVFNAIAIDTLI